VLEGAVIRRIELMGPGALGLKPVHGAPRDPVQGGPTGPPWGR